MNPTTALLEVRDLKVHFPLPHGILNRRHDHLKAVDGVSFTIAPGQTLGLVGESGCGKSTVARTLVGLIKPTSGSIRFEGNEICALSGEALRGRRRHLQMIFQDPYNSLDPRFTVQEIIGEGLEVHGLRETSVARRARVADLLRAVGLTANDAARYPHEFSGGQRQRIGIARALAVEPKLIVCDEPVSALDVSVQAQVVNLLQDLQQERGLAYLFIAHDLAVVEHISDRMMVMYLGKIVEFGNASEVVRSPRHPYTQALLSAVPVLDAAARRRRIVLSGDVPSPIHIPTGCPFHTRCPKAKLPECRDQVPAWIEAAPAHHASCHFAREEQTQPARLP